MGKYQRIDPALARVVEALADLAVDRDLRLQRAGVSDAHASIRPLLDRPAERPLLR